MHGIQEYIILIIGSFLASLITGTAGVGGAIILLPLLARITGITAAIPIFTIAELISNIARTGYGIQKVNWKKSLLFISTAVPTSALGAMIFINIPKEPIIRGLGLAIAILAVLKITNKLKFNPGNGSLLVGGAISGILSGIFGTAGPLSAAIFITQNLSPIAYISTEGATAIFIHTIKTIVYQSRNGLNSQEILLGLFMGIAMAAGTWIGIRIIRHINQEKFQKIVILLILMVGLEMLIFG